MVDISGKTCYNISTLPMGEGSGAPLNYSAPVSARRCP